MQKQKLYSKATEKKFEEEYGKEKGDKVFGAEVGIQYRRNHHGKNWNQK